MWEDYEYNWEDDSGWYNDYVEPPLVSDPYGGLGSYYEEMFGKNWESKFTTSELEEIKKLSNMNDDEFTTDDASQTGGFWNDLGNLFTTTAGSVLGGAITNAGAAGTAWAKKNITPATTATPAPAAPANTNLLIGALVLVLIGWIAYKQRP